MLQQTALWFFATALAQIPHGNFVVMLFDCCISNNVSLYLVWWNRLLKKFGF